MAAIFSNDNDENESDATAKSNEVPNPNQQNSQDLNRNKFLDQLLNLPNVLAANLQLMPTLISVFMHS